MKKILIAVFALLVMAPANVPKIKNITFRWRLKLQITAIKSLA